jgi:Sel1 repeat
MLGLNQPSPNQPSIDSLREAPFSGLDSFFEHEPPEQPKTGGRRILLLVLLLAALGGAGWWTYTKYLGAMGNRKPETATSSAREAPAEKPAAKPAPQDAAPAPDAGASQTVATSAGVPPVAPSAGAPAGPSESAGAGPEATPKTAETEAESVDESKPAAPAKIAPVKPIDKRAAKHASRVTSAKASKLPPPKPADTGDAAFRKGEAYLYGRGAPKNCDQAVKYLKTASAQSNAKARSTFGTMYATGHCVPRDLPTSYLWFALALRVDPNNQILEKDLSAVWNQMTPPERQLATRMKQ